MKAVVLAAGFATRLYPLTRDFPKPFIEIGGISILDRLMLNLAEVALDEIVVVCNRRFETHFRAWRPAHVHLVVNEAFDSSSRLGAVADLALALDASRSADVLVAAADTLFCVSLVDVVAHFQRTRLSTVCVWRNPDPVDRCRRGNVLMDGGGRLLNFVEKPAAPRSEWSSAPLYVYRSEDVDRVTEYLDVGGNRDAPGHFAAWLSHRLPMSTYRLPQEPIDIGNHKALALAREAYAKR